MHNVDGEIRSMVFINEEGGKFFAPGANKRGCFAVVGGFEALQDAPAIIIAEGYATAATITGAMKFATVAAMDSGNVQPVAEALRQKYPDKTIVIAADDDRHLETLNRPERNVGKYKGEIAAAAVGAILIMPQFRDDDYRKNPKGHTDFNDMARSSLGLNAVRLTIAYGIDKARNAASDKVQWGKMGEKNIVIQDKRLSNHEDKVIHQIKR